MLEGKKVNLRTGEDFDPVPMDRYTVQCIDVNLVMQQKFQSVEEEEVLNYQFVILDDKPMPLKEGQKTADTTRGRYLWKRCRLALNSRSWLGKLAKAVVGRELTKEEMDQFDVESVVGQQIDVMVEHSESKDGQKVYVNIISFAKPAKKLEPIANSEKPAGQRTIEKATAPAQAPVDEDDPDKLIADLDEESKGLSEQKADGAAELEAAEAEAAELEAAAKVAAAKAKLAKLKAAGQ